MFIELMTFKIIVEQKAFQQYLLRELNIANYIDRVEGSKVNYKIKNISRVFVV